MSKIGEQLQRLHKPVASMGFGFVPASAPRRQMLLIVRFDSLPGDQDVAALESADFVVVPGASDGGAQRPRSNERLGDVPVGAWLEQVPELPVEATQTSYDFLVCDLSGPIDAVARKGRGLLMLVGTGVESSLLRAIGESGVDAAVLDAKTLDLSRLSSVVECRRVRLASGKPVILYVDRPVEEGQLVVLWQAGVDGLLVDSAVGAEILASIRSRVDCAPFEARPGGAGASIGVYVGALSQPDAEEGGGDGDDDDDDDDDG